jgi:SAM-dependent methyltransferase
MFRWRFSRTDAGPPQPTVTREDYRIERLAFLRTLIDPSTTLGLEIGAFDLPTVLPEDGDCEFADWRSESDLVRAFGVSPATVAPVKYVIAREGSLCEQISSRFDYVLACHVLEHVPDPLGFIADAARLVRPRGIVMLAVPDKRRTLDGSRPSTSLDDVLERHYRGAKQPSLAHVMDFARAWLPDGAQRSLRELYDLAVQNLASGEADPHCNVWRDEELFAQLDSLVAHGFLPGLEVAARGRNKQPFNEFHVALRVKPDGTAR